MSRRPGLTLIELLVVLVVLALTASLAAPAFLVPEPEPGPPLARLLTGARELAAKREETVRLRVESGGGWSVEGVGAPVAALAAGRLDPYDGPAFTLAVSPLGSCGFDLRSGAAAALPLDPLTCELRP